MFLTLHKYQKTLTILDNRILFLKEPSLPNQTKIARLADLSKVATIDSCSDKIHNNRGAINSWNYLIGQTLVGKNSLLNNASKHKQTKMLLHYSISGSLLGSFDFRYV